MPTASRKRIARLALALMLLLVTAFSALFVVAPQRVKADDGGYPWAGAPAIPGTNPQTIWGYTTCPSNDGNCMAAKVKGSDGNTYGAIDPYGFYLRYCTSFVAWKLNTVNQTPFTDNNYEGKGVTFGDASNWGAAATAIGLAPDHTPTVGSVAWFGTAADHVAWVSAVNSDGTVQVEEYNNPAYSGNYYSPPRNITATSATYIHFPGSGNTTPTPTIIALKSSLAPDGAIETFAATNSRVTQHWYYDGGNSGTTDLIDKPNIVGIDKLNIGSTEALYTAVSDGVWETTWVAGGSGPQSAKIVTGLSGVRAVFAENTFDSNGYRIHHLYILASDGPYEAYWEDSDPTHTVHVGRLTQINGGIAMTHSIGPDGSEQLYVAVPTWVYEVSWFPNAGITVNPVINIPQGDIQSVDKGANLSGGGQLLYTTTSTTVWQTYWTTTGGPYSQGTIATSQVNAIQGLKVVTPDGVHHVYLATPDHVQEYWWLGASSGGGELIRISQGNIATIAQQLDGSMQLLFTAAANNVWETYWNSSQAPTTPSSPLFTVAA